MNKINPRKLLNSKWTATSPVDKEKHFTVTEIKFAEDGSVISCTIEAVICRRPMAINWQDLKDASQWLQGWK
jgi:tryptophan-rich hypothetical protein